MKKQIVELDERKAYERAKNYFIKICGFKNEIDKHEKILSLGMDARSQGVEGIRIKAVISSHGAEVFHNHKVIVDGIKFNCSAFEQIEQNCVKKVYAYVLTVGECNYREKDDIVKQVFCDIWGTAYTDSARDLLEEWIRKDLEQEFLGQFGQDIYLSDAFGPGFYGMEVSQSKDLCQILNAERIGIQVKESGIMLPLKSCTGLYFVVTDSRNLPHPNCRECVGNYMGCSFCRFRQEHWDDRQEEII